MYDRFIIKNRPHAVKTAYHKYWGGIGDFVYMMAFTGPVMDSQSNFKHVLVADAYSKRYADFPILDMCRVHDRFDELWIHPRKGGGAQRWPDEIKQSVAASPETSKVYYPGVYYDKRLAWCNTVPYNTNSLRSITANKPIGILRNRGLMPTMSDFPSLSACGGRYITIQPRTSGKPTMNEVSVGYIQALSGLGITLVVLLSSSGIKKYPVSSISGLPNVVVIPTPKFVDAVAVIENSVAHFGIESSLAMVAMVLGKPVVTLKACGLGHFIHDLSVTKITELPFGSPPSKVVEEVSVWLP